MQLTILDLLPTAFLSRFSTCVTIKRTNLHMAINREPKASVPMWYTNVSLRLVRNIILDLFLDQYQIPKEPGFNLKK